MNIETKNLSKALEEYLKIISMSLGDFTKKSQKPEHVQPRYVFIKAAFERRYNPSAIADILGMNRASAYHGSRKFDELNKYNLEFRVKYENIYQNLLNILPPIKNSLIKVFLCGNVSHDWSETRLFFSMWQKRLEGNGYSVYNPITATFNKEDFKSKIKHRIKSIISCNAVCYIHAFDQVELEAAICTAMELKVITIKELIYETA